jgi:hypothetical protein
MPAVELYGPMGPRSGRGFRAHTTYPRPGSVGPLTQIVPPRPPRGLPLWADPLLRLALTDSRWKVLSAVTATRLRVRRRAGEEGLLLADT